MRRYKKRYGTDLTGLSLMEARGARKFRVSGVEAFLFVVPMVFVACALFATIIPEIGFVAECQNIPGGDFCIISLR